MPRLGTVVFAASFVLFAQQATGAAEGAQPGTCEAAASCSTVEDADAEDSVALHSVSLLQTHASAARKVSFRNMGAIGAVGARGNRSATTATPTTASGPQSVMGAPLSPCSTNGTAMTGFMRDGKCRDVNDDAGSHHICIKMRPDFCTVTGQPNWCEEKMDCMGQEGQCDIENWCVCQWAFAGYISMAGGCDSIVDLECNATNMAALRAYEESGEATNTAALNCIRQKCGLSNPTTN